MIVRRARAEDEEAVLDFASATWDGWDYIPHAWPVWLAADDGVLLVLEPGRPADGSQPLDHDGRPLPAGRPVAVARVAMLSANEVWLEGIRVDPRVRGMDVATNLQVAELHWAAAQGASVVRYATGGSNEGSHRLGARHGFSLLVALRTFWWAEPDTPQPAHGDEENGFDEQARLAGSAVRQSTLARLAAEDLVASAADASRSWSRISDDATFNAAGRLYEHRPWALQELSEDAFTGHLERGEVLITDSAERDWALAIVEREALPAEDVSLHLGLLAGDGRSALGLARAVRRAAGTPIRFRLPADDPPLLRGQDAAFAAAGFRPREWTLDILARPLDADHPLPAAGDSRQLVLVDQPRRLLP
jgi:GNAT superfamily N-acetyltransferase